MSIAQNFTSSAKTQAKSNRMKENYQNVSNESIKKRFYTIQLPNTEKQISHRHYYCHHAEILTWPVALHTLSSETHKPNNHKNDEKHCTLQLWKNMHRYKICGQTGSCAYVLNKKIKKTEFACSSKCKYFFSLFFKAHFEIKMLFWSTVL